MNFEVQYLDAMKDILENGIEKSNRTGVDTKSLWGVALRHDYAEGFPLITTKKMFFRGVIHELLWFLQGTEDATYLLDNDVHIWDEWMTKDKTLPETYGCQWRNFNGIDQIQYIIDEIKTNPDSRRLYVSAWNPAKIKTCALPWCHLAFQFNVTQNKYLTNKTDKNGEISIAVTMRSGDWLLGVPFPAVTYSLLLFMIAEITNYEPKSMFFVVNNAHIYNNHYDACKLQLSRNLYPLPTVKVTHRDNIDDFVFDDFKLSNYQSHPTIKAPVAV